MTTVKVVNSSVKGSVIGGNNYEITISPPAPDPELLRGAIKQLETLSAQDEEFADFLERFEYYVNDHSGRPVIGLENKLINGGREDLIESAIEHKDRFVKRISRGQMAGRRQYIYYYVLQKLHVQFDVQIRPLLRIDTPSHVVDMAILNEIVSVVYSEVSQVDPSIDMHLIYGMLYFLTGKCHLVWEV
ncbi:ABC-three component system protein [Pseudomonas sp.]|uniref:ABC-three component system protein n=1 Tax=Pseudomonas sp. TaxID=306 RepID=UPI002B64973A|nr:ABC-three component system protein [Pseudomonas sp.]HUE93070.1 ABC-three component system protein [Pseudomonas sp.]